MTLKAISENLFTVASYGAWGMFIGAAWADLLPKDGPMAVVCVATMALVTASLLVDAVRFIRWLAQQAGR